MAGTLRPGVLCTIAALGAGFAMDIFICLPAEELYVKKVGSNFVAHYKPDFQESAKLSESQACTVCTALSCF